MCIAFAAIRVPTTHSNRLFHPRAGEPQLAQSALEPSPVDEHLPAQIDQQLRETVFQESYPCVAAVQALSRNDYAIGIYGTLGTARHWQGLRADLLAYLAEQQRTGSLYRTMFAVFPEASEYSEEAFERAMWHELSSLTSSEERSTDWSPGAISDPEQPGFVFSLGGQPLFVVGVHPHSSRRGRRFPFAGMVFNAFAQFEQLERKGSYERMVKVNRERDLAFDGSVNPMVEQYGDKWEAIQFSGKSNSSAWKCPFRFLWAAEKA